MSENTAEPGAQTEGGFGFSEAGEKPDIKKTLKRPSTIVSVLLGLAVVGFVVWIQQRAISTDLPAPRVSYELLPNIGLTEGVPIAVKLNQIAVFRISDPLGGGGGAERAKAIVENLEGAIEDLEESPGREITLDESGAFPAIVQQAGDGTGRRTIIELTGDDVILAGLDSPKAVARLWAERLTDSLKLLMFAEPPQFTEGSEFGGALFTMYQGARGERGEMSGDSLEESFEELNELQQLSLAELPPRPEPEEGDESEDSEL